MVWGSYQAAISLNTLSISLTIVRLPVSIGTRVLQNTIVLVAGQIIGVFLSFIASIFLVRSLGNVGFGQYSVVYSFLTLFGWLVSFGTDNLIVRDAAKNPQEADRIWSNGICTQILFSGLTIGVMVVIALGMGYRREMVILFLLASMEMIILIPWRFVGRIFQVRLQQWRAVTATLIRQTLWLIILVIGTHFSVSLQVLIGARTVITVLEVLLLWWWSKPFFNFHPVINYSRVMDLLKISWPLALAALSASIYHRVDQVMIERFLTAGELGYYATAVNLAGLMSIIPNAFMASVYPLLCQHVTYPDRFERIANTSFRWLLSSSIVVACLFVIVGEPLVVFIYGNQFAYSGRILGVLGWSQVAICFGVIAAQILISREKQLYLTLATIVGAIVNILGNIVILPRYGIIGAAWVNVFSYSLASIFIFVLFNVTRSETWKGFIILLKIGAIGGICLGISVLLTSNVLLAGSIFLSVFLICLWGGRIITQADLGLLANTLHIKV
jgi:O-antigen/teichoic acid export membrane protein